MDRNIIFKLKEFFIWFIVLVVNPLNCSVIWNAIWDKSWEFMLNGQDFHVARSRFSWWTVKISMLNGRDFHNERLRFSCWAVEVFMMNSGYFHDDRSRFSWWQVMTGWDFHNDRSRIVLFLWLKSRSTRGTSGYLAFTFHPRVSVIYLVDEFFFLLLK